MIDEAYLHEESLWIDNEIFQLIFRDGDHRNEANEFIFLYDTLNITSSSNRHLPGRKKRPKIQISVSLVK